MTPTAVTLTRRLAPALAALTLLAPAPAGAFTTLDRTTSLLSRSMSGDIPDGPSRNASVSQDGRWASVVAFESDASDLVPGDTNGVTDVFAVHRASPYADNGTPWQPGATELVSAGMDGRPANGPSYAPMVDGTPEFHRPRCVAFISDASNLVPGDTNGRPDAFVRYLDTHRTVRVSVDSRGRQADGATYQVAIDGSCTRVAFTSDATNLAATRVRVERRRVALTGRPRPGLREVYVHVLRAGAGLSAALKGMTFLASASTTGRPANGDSYDPAIANQKGKAVAFTSTATNLASGDRNASPDVYLRSMPWNARRFTTTLISATPSGRAGNGPSQHPAIDGTGTVVAYDTLASDLVPGDSNGVSDVLRAQVSGRRVSQVLVSHDDRNGQGNGASSEPEISYGGQFVLFQSAADNFENAEDRRVADLNRTQDVFLWTVKRRRVWLESESSALGQLTLPSDHGRTSAHGNYLLFETADPLVDLPLIGQLHAGWLGKTVDLLGRLLHVPAVSEVYMRYLGPQ